MEMAALSQSLVDLDQLDPQHAVDRVGKTLGAFEHRQSLSVATLLLIIVILLWALVAGNTCGKIAPNRTKHVRICEKI